MIWWNSISRVLVFGTRRTATAVVSLALACVTGIAASADAAGFKRTLEGMAEGDGVAQPGYEVLLSSFCRKTTCYQ
jgi:hypothetical protein